MAVRLKVDTLTLIAEALVRSATLFVTLFTNRFGRPVPLPSRPARTFVKS